MTHVGDDRARVGVVEQRRVGLRAADDRADQRRQILRPDRPVRPPSMPIRRRRDAVAEGGRSRMRIVAVARAEYGERRVAACDVLRRRIRRAARSARAVDLRAAQSVASLRARRSRPVIRRRSPRTQHAAHSAADRRQHQQHDRRDDDEPSSPLPLPSRRRSGPLGLNDLVAVEARF